MNLTHTSLPSNISETTKILTHQLTHFYRILCESFALNAPFSIGACVEGGSNEEGEGVVGNFQIAVFQYICDHYYIRCTDSPPDIQRNANQIFTRIDWRF